MMKPTIQDAYDEAIAALGDLTVVNRFQTRHIIELEAELEQLKGQALIDELATMPITEDLP